ncbi:hypothetical protein KDL01_18505 [Actinospica durhamensis]|uniref:GCN5-related N-acetyltransferase Rv2170-like domain-containing protein n=1 Tax=Actinospica durhamensis TaxID=1508375 RepID=A0A941IRG2_9ACTN|nr:GNAT family N-acetyltransferase [Actinospica durhamensis]MBR7835272.1 hypothetical protein [Actinospica durhamensis]
MTNLEDLIRRWHLGWRASRDLPAAVASDDMLWIHCAQAKREFEALALRADEDPESIARIAARVLITKERTWLTVATRSLEGTLAAVEAAGLEVLHRSETLMGTDLTGQSRRPLDGAYTCDVRVEGSAIHVEILDGSGDVAARGQIGLAGADAVADRIETMSEHRRRGLGGVVMSTLAAEAVARGARNGLLIASADGQRLYSTLGWDRLADVVIAQAPGA